MRAAARQFRLTIPQFTNTTITAPQDIEATNIQRGILRVEWRGTKATSYTGARIRIAINGIYQPIEATASTWVYSSWTLPNSVNTVLISHVSAASSSPVMNIRHADIWT